MEQRHDMITEKSLYYWVLRRHRPEQLLIFVLILLSIALQVIPLELQKRIVNIAIKTGDLQLLIYYSLFFLMAFVLFGLLKFAVNMMQARLGQKILFEIRQNLYGHILQLPMNFFRTNPPGTVINALSGELGEVGHFIGGAVTVPITILLTLIAFGGYMFYLNPILAAISLSIYPFEILLIPFLQKKYNAHNRRRISTVRRMSNRINESVSGIHEIQGNAVYAREQKGFDDCGVSLLTTMKDLFLIKFFIKTMNNYFQNTGPFLLFIVGGYLSIKGEFSLGALIACLSAYEKVYDPWKEMIGFYQGYQDASVRYQRVMETFNRKPDFTMSHGNRDIIRLQGDIQVRNLGYSVKKSIDLLKDISFEVRAGEHLAIVGFSGSGKSTLALILGQLYKYQRGEILLGGRPQKELSKSDISCNLGYVAQQPYIFDSTVMDNILLGTTHECSDFKGENPVDPHTPERFHTITRLIDAVGLTDDILRFALESRLSKELRNKVAEVLISFRPILRRHLDSTLQDKIEMFDAGEFLTHTDIYGNLVFSDSLGEALSRERIAFHKNFRKLTALHQLDDTLIHLGYDIARQSTMLLKNLSDDPHFFKATPVPREKIHIYDRLIQKYPDGNITTMEKTHQNQFFTLALAYVPARHKIAVIPGRLQKKILLFRRDFLSLFLKTSHEECTHAMNALLAGDTDGIKPITSPEKEFTVYCPGEYLASKTVMENLLFGGIKSQYASAYPRIKEAVVESLKQDNRMYEELIKIGLEFPTGSQGSKLSGGQKQKIALVRAFLKDPPVLILDEATAGLDNISQKKVQSYITEELKGRTTVLSIIHRLDLLPHYDNILVLKEGKIVEKGKYKELVSRKGALFDLIQGH